MVQLATQRTALLLYALLVVLPAVVFGSLLWDQLTSDHADELAAVPDEARNAAERVVLGVHDEFNSLVDAESKRHWSEYKQDIYVGGTTETEDDAFVHSPLFRELAPKGVLGWYSYEWNDGKDAEFEPLTGWQPWSEENFEKRRALTEFAYWLRDQDHSVHANLQIELREIIDKPENFSVRSELLNEVAIHRNDQRDLDCITRERRRLDPEGEDTIDVRVGRFFFRYLRDREGREWVVANRHVLFDGLPEDRFVPACFQAMERPTHLLQAVVIDAVWLREQLPEKIAATVLGENQRLLLSGRPDPGAGPDDHVGRSNLFAMMEFQDFDDDDEDWDLGQVSVAINSSDMAQSFRIQLAWFAGVAAVMIISLSIGIYLLFGSVRASQDQARRTENFVAAITHELRTPIASVKLYGEMLRDGWAADQEKQDEYVARILSENDRLDTLVDRVLQKRRFSIDTPTSEPGDLNDEVRTRIADLAGAGGPSHSDGDLAFVLAEGLPPVLLIREALREILVNLIENARKYAPVDEGSEPIRVVTRLDRRGRVVLEVMDRGPGIPEDQRKRVFDAFYRLGDEATRSTRGTGLGLHLVQIQSRAMKARVQALPREGGGTVFRIVFKTLKASARA